MSGSASHAGTKNKSALKKTVGLTSNPAPSERGQGFVAFPLTLLIMDVRKVVRVQAVDATLACKSTCRSLESSRKRSFDQVELPLESTPEKDVGLSLRS
jgi:hypothetical protein